MGPFGTRIHKIILEDNTNGKTHKTEHKLNRIHKNSCHSPTQPNLKVGIDNVMGWPTPPTH